VKHFAFLTLLFVAGYIVSCSQEPRLPKVTQISNEKVLTDNGIVIQLPNQPGIGGSTVFLVRHADKILDDSPNPSLSGDGVIRAAKLDSLLRDVELAGVFASSTNRAMETAKPVADRHGLTIYNYDPEKPGPVFPMIFEFEKGKKFLVIGHSNTMPEFIHEMVGDTTEYKINEKVYDDFFVLTANERYKGQAYGLKY
jgi:phosphohistidine phosphatase SixA